MFEECECVCCAACETREDGWVVFDLDTSDFDGFGFGDGVTECNLAVATDGDGIVASDAEDGC